jgi:hypothetical protein
MCSTRKTRHLLRPAFNSFEAGAGTDAAEVTAAAVAAAVAADVAAAAVADVAAEAAAASVAVAVAAAAAVACHGAVAPSVSNHRRSRVSHATLPGHCGLPARHGPGGSDPAGLGTAAIAAMFIDSVAHDNLGLGFDAIRFGALNTAAAIFALLARGSALRGKK